MNTPEIVNNFENGKLFSLENLKSLRNTEWNPHKTFQGVALKHLITSVDTNNEISYHLVRVEPGCEIGLHTHESSMEIHEVISGNGSILLEDREYEYISGNITIIPKNKIHKVTAGKDGLYLLAKFIPALL
jgi:quercetin dioxygenase-like cupin family protein